MHDPEIGDLAEYFPILIQGAELNLTGFGFQDIYEIITTSISQRIVTLTPPRISNEVNKLILPLKDTPLLLAYAGIYGFGLPSEESAQDIKFSVLKDYDEAQIL
jgi:hypothetical protein